MLNTELTTYVKNELQRGISREVVAAALLKEGWTLSDVEAALGAASPVSKPVPAPSAPDTGGNRHWVRRIPNVNRVTGVVMALLIFTLDLGIVRNDRSLMEFWYLMLGVLGIFAVFYILENFVFRSILAGSPATNLDTWMTSIVSIRDFVFVLNAIPFIQLIGLGILYVAGIPLIIIYIVVMSIRIARHRRLRFAASQR